MHSAIATTTLTRAKQRAKTIRAELANRGETINHSAALELVAQEMGFRDWNTAVTRLINHPDISVDVGDHVRGVYLGQSFTAIVRSVTSLGTAGYVRISLELDEAVDVVRFDSFSAWRKRVNGTIDMRGQSPAKTSDGQPQLVILGQVRR